MKYALLLLLLLPVVAIAQRDFDYSFYTFHCKIDTPKIELTLYRKIQKENNTLKIISLNNTADCETYPLQFHGAEVRGATRYVYGSLPIGTKIFIRPLEGIVEIVQSTSTQTFYP